MHWLLRIEFNGDDSETIKREERWTMWSLNVGYPRQRPIGYRVNFDQIKIELLLNYLDDGMLRCFGLPIEYLGIFGCFLISRYGRDY